MMSNCMTFWIVPVAKLNTVLREHPQITVPVVIIDEFTVDTPKEKAVTDKSPVLKYIITQATPHALESATSGCNTWLKQLLGGQLQPPRRLVTNIQYRSYKDAQTIADQRVTMDLLTRSMRFGTQCVTTEGTGTERVGCALCHVQVQSMATALMRRQVDIFPVNFVNSLLHLSSYSRAQPPIRSKTHTNASATRCDIPTIVSVLTASSLKTIEVSPCRHRTLLRGSKNASRTFAPSVRFVRRSQEGFTHICNCTDAVAIVSATTGTATTHAVVAARFAHRVPRSIRNSFPNV